MSGYKPGYSEAHSPTWELGCADARRDNELISNCPPIPEQGPDNLRGAMYMRGYDSMFNPGMRHVCGPGCPQFDRARREQEAKERAEKERQERENARSS